MTSLLSNPFFWLGQIGLLLAVISCQALIEIRQQTAKRAYIYSLWAISGIALWCMGTPLTGGHPLPTPLYLLEFCTGLVFSLGYYQVRANTAIIISPAATTFLRRLVWLGGIGGLVLICGISFVVAFKEQKALAEELLKKEEQRRREQALQHKETIQAIVADTSMKATTKAQFDTVKGQLVRAKQEAARAKAERDALKKQANAIKRDTETLKRAATRNGRQLPAIDKIKPQDTLKHETKKGFFKRLFGRTRQSDSLGTVAHH